MDAKVKASVSEKEDEIIQLKLDLNTAKQQLKSTLAIQVSMMNKDKERKKEVDEKVRKAKEWAQKKKEEMKDKTKDNS